MVFLNIQKQFKDFSLSNFFISLFVYEMYEVKVSLNPHLKYIKFSTTCKSLHIMEFLDSKYNFMTF